MTEIIEPAAMPELRSAFVAELRDIDVRQSGNGEEFTLTGHAAVFNRWSEDLFTWAGTFREKIAKGAFTDVLNTKPDVRLLFNHDGMTLARTKSGTLELSEDDEGLRVWARLSPDMQLSRDLRAAMLRGDVDQMSFAFTIAEDEWHEDHDTEEVERTILRVAELFDVSVVSFPAYPDTDATMRELRCAAEAGKITASPPKPQTTEAGQPIDARAETDPAVAAANGDTSEAAPAETDPAEVEVDPIATARTERQEVLREEREAYLRLCKELTK